MVEKECVAMEAIDRQPSAVGYLVDGLIIPLAGFSFVADFSTA